MVNARRIKADSLAPIFESQVNKPFTAPQISLHDGETREAHDLAARHHPQVPNRLLKALHDVYVQEVRAKRDPRASQELRQLLMCPIAHDTMQQPVVDPYGHHFNAAELKQWIDLGNRRAPLPGRSQNYCGDSIPVVVDQRVARLIRALGLELDLEGVPPSPWRLPTTMHAPSMLEAQRDSVDDEASVIDGRVAVSQAASAGATVGAFTGVGCAMHPLLGASCMLLSCAAAGASDSTRELRAWFAHQVVITMQSLSSGQPWAL